MDVQDAMQQGKVQQRQLHTIRNVELESQRRWRRVSGWRRVCRRRAGWRAVDRSTTRPALAPRPVSARIHLRQHRRASKASAKLGPETAAVPPLRTAAIPAFLHRRRVRPGQVLSRPIGPGWDCGVRGCVVFRHAEGMASGSSAVCTADFPGPLLSATGLLVPSTGTQHQATRQLHYVSASDLG